MNMRIIYRNQLGTAESSSSDIWDIMDTNKISIKKVERTNYNQMSNGWMSVDNVYMCL